jgi:CDP-diacylglycerol--serine O-phosphatidyltransferase
MIIPRNFIPSLFTILNAFCGFMSIIHSANGNFSLAGMFIIYAALFDAVDGIAARLTNSTSDFGVELDSLADVISFGLAPSFLLYSIYFNELSNIGIVISSLVFVFAAIRLARFNVQLTGHNKDYFNGLPSPVSSLTIVTYIIFYHNRVFSVETSSAAIIFLSVLLPVLMVSKFRYETFPKPSLKAFKENPPVFIIIFIAAIVSIVTRGEAVFILCLVYISTGIMRSIYNMIFKKKKSVPDNRETVTENELNLKQTK